jgi:hypothetical protein
VLASRGQRKHNHKVCTRKNGIRDALQKIVDALCEIAVVEILAVTSGGNLSEKATGINNSRKVAVVLKLS